MTKEEYLSKQVDVMTKALSIACEILGRNTKNTKTEWEHHCVNKVFEDEIDTSNQIVDRVIDKLREKA